MARSGQDARRPPRAVTPAGGAAAPQTRTPDFDHRTAMRLVRLGVVNHVLRSRRFYERVVLAVIVLRALRGMGQENRASTMARLSAWNKRQVQRLEARLSARPERSRAPGRWRAPGRRRAWRGRCPRADDHRPAVTWSTLVFAPHPGIAAVLPDDRDECCTAKHSNPSAAQPGFVHPETRPWSVKWITGG